MIHYEILPQEQKRIYKNLSFLKNKGFILFGGTAIALQLGHRQSIDFDFFTSNKLDKKLKDEILKNLKSDTMLQNEENTLVFLKNEVKLSFFGDIDFAIRENSLILDDVLEVANLKSLLATKLKATFDRAEYKDYIDIVEILKTGQITIEEGINKMFDFFGTDFTASQVLKNLTYFEDGDLYRLEIKDRDILIQSVLNFKNNMLETDKKDNKKLNLRKNRQ
ncbi:nucleotidyl transferase AbiEii/AbiGii toxin family protein [Campylobacter ureolyticus]|uniref:nucleotidyl transferase AbiEii/AbiGii toxin family protein n=1 Tax=Campylobacter ureolyticus TaxID=827 RepID=UPI0022B440EB|nr:nucleotidyl transferase AbiEii/AbiGii toxin family protein [Campylobacter ureolyticus]MCZ6164202.1 nucleotidyl transferase AbiEii/AbiGii toxin family protein [Campylobacter ureolyticus]MCZ6166067.1 nucleotidyl transferase AbiEii/AbiGii toxin family protein [Campylobacter ureolyticus]